MSHFGQLKLLIANPYRAVASPEFCFRGAKHTFPNIGGANYGFTVIKSQILQVLKHPSPPCCDATGGDVVKLIRIRMEKFRIKFRYKEVYLIECIEEPKLTNR